MQLTRIAYAGMTAIATAALVAGCSSGGDDDDSGDSTQSLEERLFSGNQADFAKQQELIRDCMVNQGFEYTPQDNRSNEGPQRPDENSEEYIKEYGFGVSTMFATEFKFDPGDDPNFVYRNSLDETQKKAYDIALYGQDLGGGGMFTSGGGGIAIPAIPVEGGDDGEVGRPEVQKPGGCLGEALEATGQDTPVDASLFDDLQEMEDRIKSDPKMVEAYKEWSSCMADSGYSYKDPDEAIDELREEFAEITGLEISGDGGIRITVSREVNVDGTEGGEAFDPLKDADPVKLAALREKELRIAGDAYDCAKDTVLKVEQEIRGDYEEQFLEDHPELESK